jgi:hypothetical protein
VLDGSIHAEVGVIGNRDGAIDQEAVVAAAEFIVEIGRRRIETVGIAMVLVLVAEEVGAGTVSYYLA